MTSKRGIITVISGFSGAGKGTLVKELLAQNPGQYWVSVSATSRKPRPGEREGIEYFYKSVEEFENMIQNDEFFEHAKYVDNYYGTPKGPVLEKIESGIDVILEIELQGALNVKKQIQDALLLFVVTPDCDTLFNRLKGRDSESDEVIAARMNRAVEEVCGIDNYDFMVVNDDINSAARRVHYMIQNEKYKISANAEFINRFKDDLEKYKKGDK